VAAAPKGAAYGLEAARQPLKALTLAQFLRLFPKGAAYDLEVIPRHKKGRFAAAQEKET
jgi:hypothetical protein